MKRILTICLVFTMVLAMVACGAPAATGDPAQTTVPVTTQSAAVFKAGFGYTNITPKKDGLPLAGHSDGRLSEGFTTYLEARAVAVQDEQGEILLFVSADLSFIRPKFGKQVMDKMTKELGIPEDHIVLSGTHTHGSIETESASKPGVHEFNEMASDGMVEAARLAIEDLKPSEIFVGTAVTENMNFVRRYFMDDGSLTADNTAGTGTKIISHETEADPDLVMMKFVREGGKDILISNFQAHPHMEGKTPGVSAETVGAMRDAFEEGLGVHSLHWQGAAGNLNSRSRIDGETRTTDRKEYAQIMLGYAKEVYDKMTPVESGLIQVVSYDYEAIIDHSREHLLDAARQVTDYFKAGNNAEACKPLAQSLGLEGYHQAMRIVWNAENGYSFDAKLVAWSFGDVSGIVTEYELFDTAGMFIKNNSPFKQTFIVGYSYPGTGSYIPTAEAFANGGYERDSCRYISGTSEEMCDIYVDLLNQMYK